jgi:hypothetical protein
MLSVLPENPAAYAAASAAVDADFVRLQAAQATDTAMQIFQLIQTLAPILVSILAGVSTALAAVLNSQKKTAVTTVATQSAALDSAHTQIRAVTQAVAEIANKLPPPPPGGHGFTDSTTAVLLNVPTPLAPKALS